MFWLWVVGCCCWKIPRFVDWPFSFYSHSLVISFLFIEAAKELRTERKMTVIPFKLNFYSTGQHLFHKGGIFFPGPEKAVYSIEWCKEVWERVSFGCQEASCQRPPGKLLFLYLFLFYFYVIGFLKISHSFPTRLVKRIKKKINRHHIGRNPKQKGKWQIPQIASLEDQS